MRRRKLEAWGELEEQLAADIGWAATEKLIEMLGGTRIFVPRAIGVHHPIAVAIGAKAASLLAAKHAGATFDLPKAHYRRERALQTALNRPEGMTIADVAIAFDYTERWIYKMLEQHAAQQEAEDLQGRLFG
ncbi:hypothetical protein [Sphingomonas hengshuiensis]|uniref:Mor transcription activator domain-containing protein n=1 Tax=Sphingomonas hengshuiensis TaxID=1609977 RepID=A0A7U4JAB1_9SPHN|nr:hypothetical protein [Sphingomonas hengshuiensis]AJP73151.1 hypothetical protein TS85_17160 [Sphingomonas hengshuiensis]